jgi:hypothetical protein
MKYTVRKTDLSFKPDGAWEKEFWKIAATLTLSNYMGQKPQHFPKTQARLLYDDDFIYVIFRVEDRFIRAVSKEYNDPVWCDSCVEFFFTPDSDIKEGYFNIEMNCGGVMLMRHQTARDQNCRLITPDDAGKIQIFHSLPKIINPEITEPTIWTLEYQLPIGILAKYAKVKHPASGVAWCANFYKCGDETSHPHWLTWAPIDLPDADFHQPKFFGTLQFE